MQPLLGTPQSIDDVVEALTAIDAALPATDGVRVFNHMYLEVTELVRDKVGAGFFTNTAFMTTLDVAFAGLYLAAVAAKVPDRAWAPLFEARTAPGRLPIQYALAGMNAHINNDLPIAVTGTCRQMGLTPDSPGVADDYRKVNDLLATVEEQVRQSFLSRVEVEVDQRFSPVTNLVCNWSISAARDAAWTNAKVLWALHGIEPLQHEFLATLSRTVGLAGHCLLAPVADD